MTFNTRILVLAVAFVLLPFASSSAQQILIHAGTLLDPGVSMDAQEEVSILIEDGKIVSVQQGYVMAKQADQVIDLKDQYVMPGWIDMHTHLSSQNRKAGYIDKFTISPARRALMATKYAERTLMAGFTSVRDVGGRDLVDVDLRDAINAGDVVGPRMFVAGNSLSITGGHADGSNGYLEEYVGIPDESNGIVDGVDSAVRAVRMARKRRVDHIKITATAGVLSRAKDGTSAHFTDEEIRTIVDVAAMFGMKVTAHAHGDEGMRRAVINGVKSIEHGTYMSETTMDVMIDKGAYLIPTITAGKSVADSAKIANYYIPMVTKKALEVGPVIQGTFGKAYKRGVNIAFGTDAGVFPHGKNALEFGYMVEAGMPFMEALRTATVNASTLLGRYDEFGSIEPGKFADIVAVPNDPRADASTTSNVTFVMKEGNVYKD